MLTNNLGLLENDAGNYVTARTLIEKGLVLFRELKDEWAVANSLANLGKLFLDQNKYQQASIYYLEGLSIMNRLGAKQGITECLYGLGIAANGEGQSERSLCLFGVAEQHRKTVGGYTRPPDVRSYEQTLISLRNHIESNSFAKIWAQGQAMTLDEAVEYALAINI